MDHPDWFLAGPIRIGGNEARSFRLSGLADESKALAVRGKGDGAVHVHSDLSRGPSEGWDLEECAQPSTLLVLKKEKIVSIQREGDSANLSGRACNDLGRTPGCQLAHMNRV